MSHLLGHNKRKNKVLGLKVALEKEKHYRHRKFRNVLANQTGMKTKEVSSGESGAHDLHRPNLHHSNIQNKSEFCKVSHTYLPLSYPIY